MFFFRYISYFNRDDFLKKIALFTIFLTIFALTFSLVALYFANLNKLKYEKIDEIKVHQNLIQEYSGKILKLKFNLLKEEKNAFNYLITEERLLSEKIITPNNYIQARIKYCDALKYSLFLSVLYLKPIIYKADNFLAKKWDTLTIRKNYKFDDIEKKLTDLLEQFKENSDISCKKNELKKIKILYSEQINLHNTLMYIVKALKKKSKERLKTNFKHLDDNYKKTRNLLIIAFFIQLIIFGFLNFIDIRNVFKLGIRK
jgi:hypothetical protein